jgi:hypothetical protein
MSAICLPKTRQIYLQTKLMFAKDLVSAEEWEGLERRYGVNRDSYFQLVFR